MNVTVDKSGRPLLSMRFEGHGLDEARYEALSTREQLTMSLEPVFKEVHRSSSYLILRPSGPWRVFIISLDTKKTFLMGGADHSWNSLA